MEIEQTLTAQIKKAVQSLYGVSIDDKQVQISPTRKEFEGHLTLMTFPFLKQTGKKNPEELGRELGDWLVANEPLVGKYNVIKGFLNMTINASSWLEKVKGIYLDADYGTTPVTEASPLYMIEYSSPNTNKPLHLGHMRNILLGHSLSCILKACGYKVVKTNIVNDRGIHICKSMLAWLRWGNGCTPESTGKKGDHLIGDFYVEFDKHFKAEVKEIMAHDPEVAAIEDEEKRKAAAEAKSPLLQEAREMLRKWEAGDEEVRSLWRKMNEWVYAGFDETYRAIGVGFDKIYYESQTYLEGKSKVLEGLEKGIFFRKEDGSVWADLTDAGLDQKLLLRSDGTSVYMTQDIGTAKLRFQDFPIDRMVYVVGNEQNYHFQVLSLLLDRLGFKWGKDLVHFSYGMVELPNGRMKSREGTVVDADDLMASMIADARRTSDEAGRMADIPADEAAEICRKVGLGALKYFILKVDPVKNMVFNPAESIDFNGNTGPFIQYTHARISSLLRKAGQSPETPWQLDATQLDAALEGVTISTKEEGIIQMLVNYPATIKEAGARFSPALIANYIYDLVKEYNQFYHDFSILKEEDTATRNFRLVLSAAVAKVIKSGMALLGIEVPERM
jgi:arginyl-tRNA synthetase